MLAHYKTTRHFRERPTARMVPPGTAEMIRECGASRDAGDGARKFAISAASMKELKRHYG